MQRIMHRNRDIGLSMKAQYSTREAAKKTGIAHVNYAEARRHGNVRTSADCESRWSQRPAIDRRGNTPCPESSRRGT